MVTDQEPRYRFRDSNGNITGTVFERGGELVVQEGTSGNENELVLQSDGTVQAKRLAGGYLYAGGFDGSDPDARLDNALAAATSGDAIYLENEVYERTTLAPPDGTRLLGTGNVFLGTGFDGSNALTISGKSVSIRNCAFFMSLSGFGVVLDANRARVTNCYINNSHKGLQVNGELADIIANNFRGNEIELNNSGCIVDSNSNGVAFGSTTITDNGSGNVIGDNL